MMKVYLLTRIGKIGYDEYDGKVIVAENEDEARIIANIRTGDEGKIWEDPTKVVIVEVNAKYTSIVLTSFNAG